MTQEAEKPKNDQDPRQEAQTTTANSSANKGARDQRGEFILKLKARIVELEDEVARGAQVIAQDVLTSPQDWRQVLSQLPVCANRLVFVEHARWKGKPIYMRVSRQELDPAGILWTVSNDPDKGVIRLMGEPNQAQHTQAQVEANSLGSRAGRLAQILKDQKKILADLQGASKENQVLQRDVAARATQIISDTTEEYDEIQARRRAAQKIIDEYQPIELEFPIRLGED